MQRVSDGYTIIEVLIFLAISGVILGTSMVFLSGRESSTRFSQSMRDIQSKVQDWINDVPTGFAGAVTSPGSGNVNCKLIAKGGKDIPKIDATGGGVSPSPECIFLGKVIQFTDRVGPPAIGQATDQEKQVFVYSVFGRRTITPLGEDERLVANLWEANPIAAVGISNYSGTAGVNEGLTEAYTLNGGAKVKRIIKSSGVAGENSHIAGFFLSFNPGSVKSNGSADLRAYQYPLDGNDTAGFVGSNANKVDTCISLENAVGAACALPGGTPADQWPRDLANWQICFENDSEEKTAILTVSASNGRGITTNLEFKDC
jgi:hypothetical protein